MEELKAVQAIVAIGGVLLSGITTFVIMRVKISILQKAHDELKKTVTALGVKHDELKNESDIYKNKTDVLSGMMRPDKQEEKSKWEASISKDVEYLRRDMEKMQNEKS